MWCDHYRWSRHPPGDQIIRSSSTQPPASRTLWRTHHLLNLARTQYLGKELRNKYCWLYMHELIASWWLFIVLSCGHSNCNYICVPVLVSLLLRSWTRGLFELFIELSIKLSIESFARVLAMPTLRSFHGILMTHRMISKRSTIAYIYSMWNDLRYTVSAYSAGSKWSK